MTQPKQIVCTLTRGTRDLEAPEGVWLVVTPAGVEPRIAPANGGRSPLHVQWPASGLFDAVAAWAKQELVPLLEKARSEGHRLVLDADPELQGVIALLELVRWDALAFHVPIEPLRRELEKLTSWHGEEHPATREARVRLVAHPEGNEALATTAIARGLRMRALLDALYTLAKQHGAAHASVKQALAAIMSEFPHLEHKAKKQLETGAAARQRRLREIAAVQAGQPLTRVRPGAVARHRIQDLAPAERWVLLIDESGSRFGEDDLGAAPHLLGRFVGLLVPDGSTLPALPPGTHATDDKSSDPLDQRIQAILDHPSGVFGVTLGEVSPIRGDRWLAGVLETIHWVLRLMPIAGPTRLDVRIERHGEVDTGADLSRVMREVLRQLVELNPARYGTIELSASVIRKEDHPLNGYVDALAHTWGSPTPTSRARLSASGLLGPCLHSGDGLELRRTWDLLARGAALDGPAWSGLVADADAGRAGSAPTILLDQLGASARADAALWARFLATTRAHLDSKAIRLAALGHEVEWLARWQPAGTELVPQLRLAWLTARLERANHLGEIAGEIANQLEALGQRLFEEAPALVCQADLDRAVLATNRFELDLAARALDRWKDQPPAVPGLQHWGRVQSSLGQHAAFRGESAAAERLFAAALEGFARLSDPAVAARERSQTATYRAIAAMDDPEADPDAVRARVADVVGLDGETIATLARSLAAEDKYRHHLLLRYLVAFGRSAEVAAYLGAREGWRTGEGHPWPLIQGYRAALLATSAPLDAIDLLLAGVELATGMGPTLELIGTALAVAAGPLGGPPVADQRLDALGLELPAARPRIEALRQARDRRAGITETLAAALPFNFR